MGNGGEFLLCGADTQPSPVVPARLPSKTNFLASKLTVLVSDLALLLCCSSEDQEAYPLDRWGNGGLFLLFRELLPLLLLWLTCVQNSAVCTSRRAQKHVVASQADLRIELSGTVEALYLC